MCIATASVTQAKATDFVSPNGYRFTIPSAWRVGRLPGPDIVLFAPVRPDGTPNVTVVTNAGLPPDATLEKVQDAISHSHNHPDTNFKQLTQEIVTLDGERVIEDTVTYTLPDPLGKTWAKQVVFVKNDCEYEFTCTVADVAHVEYDAAFTSLLKSLRWSLPAADFTDAEIKRANTDNSPYAFITPPGWSVHPLPDKLGKGVILDTAADGNFSPNIALREDDAVPGMTIEAEQSSINTKNPATFPNYILRTQIVTTIDDLPALETSYTLGEKDKLIRGVQAYVLKGGNRYLITCTVPETGHEKYDALVDHFLLSIHFTD